MSETPSFLHFLNIWPDWLVFVPSHMLMRGGKKRANWCFGLAHALSFHLLIPLWETMLLVTECFTGFLCFFLYNLSIFFSFIVFFFFFLKKKKIRKLKPSARFPMRKKWAYLALRDLNLNEESSPRQIFMLLFSQELSLSLKNITSFFYLRC